MIQRYIREASVPGLEKLECLASGSGVRYRWLAYAEEPERISHGGGGSWLDGLTIGHRIRLVRCGVENRTEAAFSSHLGIPLNHLRQLESGEDSADTELLDEIARHAGVRREWLETGEPPMLEPNNRGFRQIVDARLKRAEAAEDRSLLVSAAQKLSPYPSALDSAAEGMPPSAAVKTGRVSPELLAKVVDSVEQWLAENRGKVRVAPDKRAMLIAVCYAHFEGREFRKQEMERFFKLVA